MVPGSKAGFEMWICDFQCAFNDFSHCKFPDCSLLHWQVDAIIGFCNIRHFMEATEVRNSLILLKHFRTAIAETTCRRLHWWRIPCLNAWPRFWRKRWCYSQKPHLVELKWIKHVLSHISSDQSLSWFSFCNPSESSEHRHQVNQVGEIVHGCHVLRPTVVLQDVKRMISDIVRYPWYPDDPWKSNRCPFFFFWKASDDLINSLRRGWFPWSTQSKHRRCLPGDLATLRWVVVAA